MATFPKEQQNLNKKPARADGWQKVGASLKVGRSYFKLFRFTRGGSKSLEDLGACLLARHVAVSPSNLRPTLPLLSTPTSVSALPPEMDGQASGMRNLLGAGQINLQSGI